MKKILFLVMFALTWALPGAAFAGFDIDGKEVIVPPGETVSSDIVDGGEMVEVAGNVMGEVMVAGADVDISGDVEGDILAAGANMSVSGATSEDMRIAGGNVNISARIEENLTVVGGNVRFDSDTVVKGNAYIGAGNAMVKGDFQGSVKAGAGTFILTGKVKGNLVVYAEEVVIREGSDIGGNFTYYSKKEARIAEGVVIGGEVVKGSISAVGKQIDGGGLKAFMFGFLVWRLLAALMVALVAWKLFSGKVKEALDDSNKDIWKKIGKGFLTAVVTPIAFVILMFTLIGIPLGLILLGLYLITAYLGMILGVAMFGKWIAELVRVPMQKNRFPWTAFLVGIIVISIIVLVPLFGFLLSVFIWWWGFGALIPLLRK